MYYRTTSGKFSAVFRGAALASLLLAAPLAASRAATQDAPWGAAAAWVGHFATEKLADGSSFFDSPAVAAQLPRVFGPDLRAELDSYTRSGRVQQVSHFLIVAKCADGGCEYGNATVILDLNSRDAWVVLKRHGMDGAERCWTGTRHDDVLPPALQAAFNVD
jgi:hypothetical protein